MHNFYAFFSNRVEVLYRHLKNLLFYGSNPFSKRIVVVPSPVMRSWLTLEMAKDKDLEIAMGLQILCLDEAVFFLKKMVTAPSKEKAIFPNALQLALAIEVEMRAALKEPQEIWQPLTRYLSVQKEGKLSIKNERRLIALSQKLATLFILYGKYGKEMIAQWEADPGSHWQAALWNAIYSGDRWPKSWSYPYKECLQQEFAQPVADLQVHLFSHSYIPEIHHRFLSSLSECYPVTYYMLSPCQAFWHDILSDKESYRYQKYWKQKGISEQQQQALEELLRDKNAMLANFGRMGRETARYIEESSPQTSQDYVIPGSALEYGEYEQLYFPDIHVEQSDSPLTLLQALQTDMVLLRNPVEDAKIALQEEHHSIQIHIAHSKMREMQVLHNVIMEAIDKKNIPPNQIVVMAPRIKDYVPYIRAVFEQQENRFSIQIMDLKVPNQSSLVQGFLHLINMPSSRWDSEAILQMIDCQPFQQKFRIDHEDLQLIREWIDKAGNLWGYDLEHRNEILKNSHCEKSFLEDSPVGTWDYINGRLLMGLIMDSEQAESVNYLPYENMESSRAEFLGRWISILEGLKKDLQKLTDGACLTLEEWSSYLLELLERYFEVSFQDKEARKEEGIIKEQIEAIRNISTIMKGEKFSFLAYKKHLEQGLEQQETIYKENCLHSIKFCSMLPMRAIPADLIVLIGMDEHSFPNKTPNFSLNLLPNHPGNDYLPSQTDFDRYLFLEAILSARKQLVVSYIGIEGGKEQTPSLVVTELMSYLDSHYQLNGGTFSELCVYQHPFLEFDKRYFLPESKLMSYSKHSFAQAKAFYLKEKQPEHLFIPKFEAAILDQENSEPVVIDLKDLIAHARDPIKHFFNKEVGIYIKGQESSKAEEAFQLSSLKKAIICREAVTRPLENLITIAHKKGELPVGLFKSLAINKVQSEYNEIKEILEAFELNEKSFFTFDLAETTLGLEKSGFDWKFPALQVGNFIITGTIKQITKRGLLAHIDGKGEDLLKAWPEFLAYCALAETHHLAFEKVLLCCKSGKKLQADFPSALPILKKYIAYYLNCKKQISPLIPQWTKQFSAAAPDPASLKEKSEDERFYNESMRWLMREGAPAFCESWKETARELLELTDLIKEI